MAWPGAVATSMARVVLVRWKCAAAMAAKVVFCAGPSAMHWLQVRVVTGVVGRVAPTISAVTMPVGTASAPAHQHHQRGQCTAEVGFGGDVSKPTVVMVVMAQYTPPGCSCSRWRGLPPRTSVCPSP